MNNLLITKENKKTKRFILVFLLFTIYFFNGSLILAVPCKFTHLIFM